VQVRHGIIMITPGTCLAGQQEGTDIRLANVVLGSSRLEQSTLIFGRKKGTHKTFVLMARQRSLLWGWGAELPTTAIVVAKAGFIFNWFAIQHQAIQQFLRQPDP
jgi:hypothetical protein